MLLRGYRVSISPLFITLPSHVSRLAFNSRAGEKLINDQSVTTKINCISQRHLFCLALQQIPKKKASLC